MSPPTWECQRVEAAVFYVAADPARLQAICDRTLNDPSGGRLRYRNVLPWVALTFQTFREMRSHSGSSWHREAHHYHEAAFWVLVDGGFGPELMIPYMFVDDWVALAAGREIYGFPKEHARLGMPPRDAPRDYAVDALAAPRNGVAGMTRIVSCNATPEGGPWAAVDTAGMDFASAIQPRGVFHDMALLIELMAGGRLPFVLLRQVRALAGGDGAELQQIVAAESRPFGFGIPADGSPWILLDYELRLAADPSHPIASDFGFALKSNGSIEVPLGFQCDVTMSLLPGAPR